MQNGGKQFTWVFRASSAGLRREWVAALQQQIERLRMQQEEEELDDLSELSEVSTGGAGGSRHTQEVTMSGGSPIHRAPLIEPVSLSARTAASVRAPVARLLHAEESGGAGEGGAERGHADGRRAMVSMMRASDRGGAGTGKGRAVGEGVFKGNPDSPDEDEGQTDPFDLSISEHVAPPVAARPAAVPPLRVAMAQVWLGPAACGWGGACARGV